MLGLELDERRRAGAMRLLAARNKGLPEQTANRLAPEEPQESGTRGEAEEFLRPGRAQPLEIDWHCVSVRNLRRVGDGREWMQRGSPAGAGRFTVWKSLPV